MTMNQKKVQYATIRDVAKLANTSTVTVSYVLSGNTSRPVSRELRERVFAAAEQLHYSKSAVASSLKGKKRGLIAVLIPQFNNIFFTRVCNSIEDVALASDMITMVCDTRDSPQRERKIIELAISQRVDGIIIGPTREGYKNTELLRRLEIPFVSVGRRLEGHTEPDYYYVGSDNFWAGYLGGEHLTQNGHKNFALIEWESDLSTVRDRKAGFSQAISSCICAGGEYIVRSSRELTVESGYNLTKELLSQHHPTALLYTHHRLAQGGIIYLQEAGVKVPENISLIIIGTPAWGQLATPPYTMINQHEDRIGTTAAELLLSLMSGDTASPLLRQRQHLFPCELLVRGSVKNLFNP